MPFPKHFTMNIVYNGLVIIVPRDKGMLEH